MSGSSIRGKTHRSPVSVGEGRRPTTKVESQEIPNVRRAMNSTSATDALRLSLTVPKASEVVSKEAKDQFKSEVLKHVGASIPLVGWVVSVADGAMTARDLLLARKIARFMDSVREAPEAEREHFSQRMAEDPDLAERTTEIVLETLDKISRAKRATLLGNAFRAYLAKKIGEFELDLTAQVLERLTDDGLASLELFYVCRSEGEISPSDFDCCAELISLGLLSQQLGEPYETRNEEYEDVGGSQKLEVTCNRQGSEVAEALGLGSPGASYLGSYTA